VRAAFNPGEGPPRWNGTMLWRGATDWPAFLTGRSMIIAGGMTAKVVLYPIARGSTADRRLTNWAVMAKTSAEATAPPRREDWSRPGRLDEVLPHAHGFSIDEVDVIDLIRATEVFWEYPVCDRDPLASWSHGRVTLLGDAAHPMYPVGSNGASQAILDARELAAALAECGDVAEALRRYEQARLGQTSEIVHSNRSGGPERVIDAVEALAPGGFEDRAAARPPDPGRVLYVLDGELTLVPGDADHTARPGDLVRLPMGTPHGLFNRSGGTVVCLFWVTPTVRLHDLFVAIDALGEAQTPEAVVALAGEHEVEFLPPSSG